MQAALADLQQNSRALLTAGAKIKRYSVEYYG